MLIYDNCYYKFPNKLQIHWLGPFCIKEVFDNGSLLVQDLDKTIVPFWVNGLQVKHYFSGFHFFFTFWFILLLTLCYPCQVDVLRPIPCFHLPQSTTNFCHHPPSYIFCSVFVFYLVSILALYICIMLAFIDLFFVFSPYVDGFGWGFGFYEP